MLKLTAQDAMFLYNDTPTTPMHVGSNMRLKLLGMPVEDYFQQLKTMLLERLHLVPYLTNRIEPTPYDIDHPVWVRDENFDIDNHLHLLTLPKDAGQEELDAAVAEIYEPTMDRTRPLWEIWVIAGANPDEVNLIQKTHHAAIDGVSSIKAQELLFDASAAPRVVEPAPEDFWNCQPPTQAELVSGALDNLSRYWQDSLSRLPQQWSSALAMGEQLLSGTLAPVDAGGARTALNASIDEKRAFSGFSMSLSELKQLARTNGVKLNDVVLAICGEALSSYLEQTDNPIDTNLLASCPVSLHEPDDTRIGNKVGALTVSMHNTQNNRLARLQAIHTSANNAKATLSNLKPAIATDFGTFGLPAQMQQLARSMESGVAVDFAAQVPAHVVVSNVPGFKQTMYVAGAEVVNQLPMSIVTHGSAVNITVISYVDRLDLGITAAASRVGDIQLLNDCMSQAYQALLADSKASERGAASLSTDEANTRLVA